MKHRLLLVICLLLGMLEGGLLAQTQVLSMEDIASFRHRPRTMQDLQWLPEGNQYSYVSRGSQNLMLALVGEVANEAMSLEALNDATGKDLRRFPAIHWLSNEQFYFTDAEGAYVLDIRGTSLRRRVPVDARARDISYASSLTPAFTLKHQLYVGSKDVSGWKPITKDGSRDIEYGTAVHRQEFGIQEGLFWSPDGSKLAFYRMDQSMVSDYPFVNYQKLPAEEMEVKYPMAGGESHHVTIGIHDVAKNKTVYLKTGAPADQYLTNIAWSPDNKEVYVAIVNRDQNHLWLQAYDARSGNFVRTLFEETHPTYVEPEHPPIFLPHAPDQFLWMSERDGYNHLYMYDTDGNLLGQLTKGDWEVTEYLGMDPKGKFLYVQGTHHSPIEQHVFEVELKNNTLRRLTPQAGTHNAKLSPDGAFLLDSYSSTEVSYEAQLIDIRKDKKSEILYTSPDPLKNFAMGDVDLISIEAEDGTELFARLIKPYGFDPNRKYPALVYLYNGPHVQLVQNRWLGGASQFLHRFAQDGYVVFTIDGRGSKHRGLAFEQAVFRQLGTLEISDQIEGLNYLKSLPFVDSTRLGVHGWSYGGFMTISMMLREPGTFSVGVAGGPVIDWKYYEVMYGERYMDRPEENPEGYEKASLLNYADQLQGDLLIVQGMHDSVVVPQHCLDFLNVCADQGKQVDFFPYLNHAHHVYGWQRVHLLRQMKAYFDERLLRPQGQMRN
ncbi:MAG: DPP IV N-terminal domain-containing protein [Bacteroidota bacterium]